jgi:hypothetical protein
LKKSIDKAYEVVTYALFSTIVSYLRLSIVLKIDEAQSEVLGDFDTLSNVLLGAESVVQEHFIPAALFRLGVANAADAGADIVSNFGRIIQVKHISLSEKLAEDMEDLSAPQIILVCKDAEASLLSSITGQLGLSTRLRAIVTSSDLARWYDKALNGKYSNELAAPLLMNLKSELELEFPFAASSSLDSFIEERGYNALQLNPPWNVDADD